MKKCGKDEKNTNTDKDEKKKSAYSVRFFSVIAALFSFYRQRRSAMRGFASVLLRELWI